MTGLADRIQPLAASVPLARAVAAVLALVCIVLFARFAWLLLAGPTLPRPSAPAVVSGPGERLPLSSYALFGDRAAAHSAPPATGRSGLRLRGTLAADDPAAGIAHIAAADSARADAYRVGERLPGGAELRAVHARHVVIDAAGTLETLPLPRLGESQEAARAAPGQAPGAAASPRPDPVAASGGYIASPLRIGRPTMASARAAAAPDLLRLAGEANLVPVLDGGRMVGVRVRVSDPALLERFGLSTEDVVVAVNDIALDRPEQHGALAASLDGGGPVRLRVRRDGVERLLMVGQ